MTSSSSTLHNHRHHDIVVLMYNAGLPAGVSDINFEFSATSDMFGCDQTEGGCPGTYGMKLSVCELECEDTKHQGHAGALVAAAVAADFIHSSAMQFSTLTTPSPSPYLTMNE